MPGSIGGGDEEKGRRLQKSRQGLRDEGSHHRRQAVLVPVKGARKAPPHRNLPGMSRNRVANQGACRER